jgi:phospholipid/cholesterol/gamma-HCH transport system substrate-binding protein
MYSRVNYTIVGVFVVLFSIGLVWFAFWLAKYGLEEEYSTYRVEMVESIAGLSIDSNVMLHGVDIGRVSDIRINPKNIEQVELILEIKKEIPIKEDMIASTQMFGVTGLLSIEIEGGTNSAATLVPSDEYLPLIKSKPSLISKFTTNLNDMSTKLDTLLSQSQKLFSDENIHKISKILDNTQKVTSKAVMVEEKGIASLNELDETLKAFRTAIAQAKEDFKMMQEDFSQIKRVSIPTIESLFSTTKDFKRVTLKFEKSLDRGDYNLKKMLEPLLVDIQILSNQLNAMSRDLGENPSGLLFKSRESRKGPGE